MHWHLHEGTVGSTKPTTYFKRETLELIISNHYKTCDCGIFSIVECDDLMCIVEAMA